jgi:2-dehydro-3-deoxy-D-gluconate 5-dehydrogenase
MAKTPRILTGQVAAITGGARGIGRETARAFVREGMKVAIGDLDLEAAKATAQELGGGTIALELNVTERASFAAFLDAAEEQLGAIDILVNNAGTIKRKAAVEHSFEDWNAVIHTNLDSVFVLSQRIGRTMVERGQGKIVNVASLLSFSGGITVPGYTASKHAVAGLTKAFANEWAQSGVNVNAIAPGYMQTENTRPLREDAQRTAAITARIPAARWGNPEDLAGAVVFLSSRASDYVNGHVLVVDGGWMAR